MNLDVPRTWAPLKIELGVPLHTHIRTATKTRKSPLVKASMLTENKYKQQDTKSYQLVHITFPSRTCRPHLGIKFPSSSCADFPFAMAQMRTPNTALATMSAIE